MMAFLYALTFKRCRLQIKFVKLLWNCYEYLSLDGDWMTLRIFKLTHNNDNQIYDTPNP